MINVALLTSQDARREFLDRSFASVADFTLCGIHDDIESLMSGVQMTQIDVVFADVDFVVNRSMATLINPYGDKKPLIVVMADDDRYALKCYEVNGVVDYWVFPPAVERFYLTLHKLRMMLSMVEVYQGAGRHSSPEKDYIFVKVNKKMIRLPLDDIFYVESVKDYIKIVTEKKSFLVYNTLTNFTASLPKDRFARIHRSYTISLDKIEAIDGNTIEIMNTKLPFTKKFINEVTISGLK